MKQILNFLKVLAAMFIGAAVNGMLMAEGIATTDSGDGAVLTGKKMNTDDSREMSPEFIRDAVDEYVTELNKTSTPFVTLLSQIKAKSKTITDMRFKYYAVDGTADSTIMTADAQASVNSHASIVVEDVSMFNVSDTIRIVDVNNQDNDEFCYINEIDNANNTLKIQVVYDRDNEAEIPFPGFAANSAVYLLGNASSEGDVTTYEFGALPTPTYNFCQIFKFQVGQSTLQKIATKDAKWDMTDQERFGAERWKQKMEVASLFNKRKGYIKNPKTGKMVYFTKGIIPEIKDKGRNLEFPSNPTNQDFVELCRNVFVGNAGSDKRIIFAGEEFITKITGAQVQNNKEANKTEVVWGLTWKVIESNFGNLLLMHHPLFGRYGYNDKAVVIDPQFVQENIIRDIERLELDLKSSGQFDGEAVVFTKIFGVALKYPDCHAIVSLKP